MHSPYDEPANQNDPNADLVAAVQNFRDLSQAAAVSSRWEMNSAVHFKAKNSVGQRVNGNTALIKHQEALLTKLKL
jgi:hypothetical protein